jgi:hypothetical protein
MFLGLGWGIILLVGFSSKAALQLERFENAATGVGLTGTKIGKKIGRKYVEHNHFGGNVARSLEP